LSLAKIEQHHSVITIGLTSPFSSKYRCSRHVTR
jgi:hypothetical protein